MNFGINITINEVGAGNITKAQNELRGLGASGHAAGFGMGTLSRGAATARGAVSHLKGEIGSLVSGPLGFIGLGAGLFSIEKLFHSSIEKVTDWGLAVEKLTGLTGESATAMSGWLAITEKFGISAERAGMIVGFTEKNLGNYTKTAKDAAKFQHQFGFALEDSRGRVKSFDTILLQTADYYNSNRSQSEKAALAAKLFGRGYADMIPILKLGSKGIKEAEQEAAALGLTLNATNARDLMKYREGMRQLGDAVGGLQLQIGIHLIPVLLDLAKGATSFISTNRGSILNFLDQAIVMGRQFGSFVGGTLIPTLMTIGHAATTAWNSIPAPLRDLLVKGFIANKAVKVLFGIDIAGGVIDAIKKAVAGGVAKSLVETGIGKLFVQPVFVTNPGFGVGGAGGAAGSAESAIGSAAGGGVLGKLLKFGAALGLGAAALELFQNVLVPLNDYIAGQTRDIGSNVQGTLGSKSNADLEAELKALVEGQNQLQQMTAGLGPLQQVLYGSQIDMLNTQIAAVQHELSLRGSGDTRSEQAMFGEKVAGLGDSLDQLRAAVKAETEDRRKQAHHAAALAREGGKGKEGAHEFLLALRSGQARMAITDFPKELAYLSTVSEHGKRTALFTRGVQDDIKALQRASIHATAEQKARLSSEIHQLQALLRNIDHSIHRIRFGVTLRETISTLATAKGTSVTNSGTVHAGALAKGAFGMLTGLSDLGVLGYAGEAGGEAVAVIRQPKAIRGLRSGGGPGASPSQISVHVSVGAGQIMRSTARTVLTGGNRRVTING